ncbi:actin family [Gigaspora rosea]|uniref:Actin family n=1 Tax=Gigaspora rosea TaxID=44941 RepID=A0A397UFB6_9GLOM|nr:actin family [Gigaspora rosea]
MHFTLKEENYVVVENGSWRIKAGIGVSDTNQSPSVIISTEVAKQAESDFDKQNENLGQQEISSTSDNSGPNSPDNTTQKVTVKEPIYICGSQLRELKESNNSIVTTFPIQRGVIVNWEALEALWRHIILKELNIKRARNECPVLVTVPNSWTKEHFERIAHIFFETFNAPGLYIANQALMTLYGIGCLSGLVVDVGYGKTEITPIIDCSVQYHAAITIPIGGQDFDEYFLSLLLSDTQFLMEYGETPDVEIARILKESDNICEVLPDVNFIEDKPDRIEVEFNGRKITIGPERFQVVNPIFNPLLMKKEGILSLPEAIYQAISHCEPDKRNILWENIAFTGGSSLFKGFRERLEKELNVYLYSSDNSGEYQIKEAKFLKLPEYFSTLKERPELAGYIGAAITAKFSFPDPKGFINKVDYNEHGPSVVHTKSY